MTHTSTSKWFRTLLASIAIATLASCGGNESAAPLPGSAAPAIDDTAASDDPLIALSHRSRNDNGANSDRPPLRVCPQNVVDAIDTAGIFDPTAGGAMPSTMTLCLQNRSRLHIVIALNSSALNGSKTQAQQIGNLGNIVADYERYAMQQGVDFNIVVVGYGAGARWLTNDVAFERFFGVDPAVTENNVAAAAVAGLVAKGVKFFMCQNTMLNTKAPGTTVNIKTVDLLPDVNMVPAGVTAVLDFQSSGYLYLAP